MHFRRSTPVSLIAFIQDGIEHGTTMDSIFLESAAMHPPLERDDEAAGRNETAYVGPPCEWRPSIFDDRCRMLGIREGRLVLSKERDRKRLRFASSNRSSRRIQHSCLS